MPSARELLEQADALMRRNRGRETVAPALGPRTMAPTLARKPAPGDFPVLTDAMEATPGAAQARRPAGPTPDAPAAAPAAAAPGAPGRTEPFLPPRAHADGAPSPASAAAVAAAAEALRASSAGPPANSEAARLREPPRVVGDVALPPAGRDAPRDVAPQPDFPVLTDAIAEIDAALAAVAAEGEPSIWNDEAMRGDDSVLGPAPKSVAVIPDSAMIDEAALRRAEASETWLEEEAREIQAQALSAAQHAVHAPSTAFSSGPGTWMPEAAPVTQVPEAQALEAQALEAQALEAQALEAQALEAQASESQVPEAQVPETQAPEAQPAGTPAMSAAATDELIEELRMQVLQRIDMFTDTGLRDQLGERLKPIVDRASAELVQTINQHVGELLRGFVAEAIERELDRLRKDVHQDDAGH